MMSNIALLNHSSCFSLSFFTFSRLFQGRTCVNVVVGVDAPTLLQQIGLNMPAKVVKE